VVERTILYNQQLRNNTIMQSNVMLRFMVQAMQDPPLCSSTSITHFDAAQSKVS
jgi:hypothetical protein